MSEKEKMISGKPYLASDPELVRDRFFAKELQRELNTVIYQMNDAGKALIKKLIPNSCDDLFITPPFHCDYGYNITCGKNVYFNVNCVVLDVAPVTIGSNCFFAPGVQLYTAGHPLNYLERRTVEFGKPITIGDDCWLGGGVIVLPGVKIGNRCVIGAGAVVTKNIPDDSLVLGNPGRAQQLTS